MTNESLKGKWSVVVFYPADFTFVCPTELGDLADNYAAARLNAKAPFDVPVVGGGNSGVEAAIDLAGLVSHVTLIEFDPQLRADAVLVRKLHSLSNVTIITGAQTTEVTGDGERVTGLIYKDRHGGDLRSVELAGVFV